MLKGSHSFASSPLTMSIIVCICRFKINLDLFHYILNSDSTFCQRATQLASLVLCCRCITKLFTVAINTESGGCSGSPGDSIDASGCWKAKRIIMRFGALLLHIYMSFISQTTHEVVSNGTWHTSGGKNVPPLLDAFLKTNIATTLYLPPYFRNNFIHLSPEPLHPYLLTLLSS